MKKEELYALGIDESHRKEFLRLYWADVRKKADQLLQKKEAKNDTPTAADLRAAIGSIVKLIPDPVRLQAILAVANRHYHYMGIEYADKLCNEATDQTAPEQDNGGGADVDTD